MIPVVQSIVGDGRDGRPVGDCMRACFASIFELPLSSVPHFAESPSWWTAMQYWLKPFGLWLDTNDYRAAPSTSPIPTGERWPSGWWMATVDSENFPGARHAVVMRGLYVHDDGDPHVVAHDPSPRPRQTPYLFYGACWFVARDPAVVRRGIEQARAVAP
jgi:hypothetical protein